MRLCGELAAPSIASLQLCQLSLVISKLVVVLIKSSFALTKLAFVVIKSTFAITNLDLVVIQSTFAFIKLALVIIQLSFPLPQPPAAFLPRPLAFTETSLPRPQRLAHRVSSRVSDTGWPGCGHRAPFIRTQYWRGANGVRVSCTLRFLPRFKSFTEIRKSAFINAW